MIKCSECGYENMDGLDYCDGCGAKLEAAAEAATAEAAATAPATEAEPASPAEQPSEAASEAAPEPSAEAASEAPAEAAAEAPPDGSEPQPEEAASAEQPTGELETPPPAPEAAPAAVSAMFKAKLTIVRGGRKGHDFPLEDGNNLVGRWDPDTGAFPEVDLDQDDPEAKISRKHALLRIESDKITIEDIGSLNGTYVNRQPRLQPGNPVELKTGDEIIIGKTFLKLVVEPLS